MTMTLIAENQEVKIYRYNAEDGQITIYQFKSGELTLVPIKHQS